MAALWLAMDVAARVLLTTAFRQEHAELQAWRQDWVALTMHAVEISASQTALTTIGTVKILESQREGWLSIADPLAGTLRGSALCKLYGVRVVVRRLREHHCDMHAAQHCL
eukprot:13927-Eustigmatos_ZCMA.PRE.1